MTHQELVQKFLRHYGLKATSKDYYERIEDVTPLLPWMIIDVAYQYYDNFLSDDIFKHMLRKHQRDMHDGFKRFIDRLYHVYTPAEYEHVTDLMDDLAEKLSNDITITHIACMNVMYDGYGAAHQGILSAVLLVNKLAKIAQGFYRAIYRKRVVFGRGGEEKQLPMEDHDIDTILKASKSFGAEYMKKHGIGDEVICDERKAVALDKALTALATKIKRWMEKINNPQ